MSAAAAGGPGTSRSPNPAAAAAWVGIPTFESSYFYRQFHSNSSIFGPRNGPTFNSGTSVRLLSLGPTDGTSRDNRDRWWGPGQAGLPICCCCWGSGEPRQMPWRWPAGSMFTCFFTLVQGVRPRYSRSRVPSPIWDVKMHGPAPHNVRMIEIRGHILICPFAKGAMGFMIY